MGLVYVLVDTAVLPAGRYSINSSEGDPVRLSYRRLLLLIIELRTASASSSLTVFGCDRDLLPVAVLKEG